MARFLGTLALAGAVLATPVAGWCLTLAAMSFDELTGHASVVVRARCIDRQVTRSAEGRIESLARFEVTERAKGGAPDVITVRQLGGSDGATTVVVPGAPLSEPGDDVVLVHSPGMARPRHAVCR